MNTKLIGLFLLALISIGQAIAAQDLAAHIDVSTGQYTWSYTLFNDELANSPNYISAFNLVVDADIVVTGTPSGWDYLTDNATFVRWFNTDDSLPYPNDIAPGGSLSGFTLQSVGSVSALFDSSLSAWDHDLDAPGPTLRGTVLAPLRSSMTVPEADPTALIASCMVAVAVLRLRRSRRKTIA
jgi:hypothetical protein